MITTNRDKYVPFHTTQDVKDALEKEANKRDVSVSRLIHEFTRDALRRAGHDCTGYEYRVKPVVKRKRPRR